MRSTFMGLEVAKRGMFAQQSALQTVGNNIANANTEGYTRQRVNMVSTNPYPAISMSSPTLPGQMGTGVELESVQRVRESFLDIQYRAENNKLGYWESRANALEKMEEIMNEPSETGLSNSLNRFWQSLQDLAVDPTNAGARSVVRERGNAVAETFNYLATSLKSVQADLKNELDVSVKEINSIANQINNINNQISQIEVHGYLPNDLYDERDRLLDQLSSLANVKVTNIPSGGNALKVAEGTINIDIVDDNGKVLGTLVDSKQQRVNALTVNYEKLSENGEQLDGLVESVSIGSKKIDVMDFNSAGKISSLIDSYGFADGSEYGSGLFVDMLKNLDIMAFSFATEFNAIHRAGWNLNDFDSETKAPKTQDQKDANEINFFAYGTDSSGNNVFLDSQNIKGAASLLAISKEIKESTNNIAAAYKSDTEAPEIGNGSNAVRLGKTNSKILDINGSKTTFQNFYEGLIGGMAVHAQEAERLTANSTVLRESVGQRRQSVGAVSLDEEMTNMIQFQHAYNASARMITIQDELLDKIINGMGVSGR